MTGPVTGVSAAENLVLGKISGPLGQALRDYWVPGLLSAEVAADPVGLRLLGRELAAFRDEEGRLGVLDAACPHRGAALYLGRNAEGGLQCVYHGWKYDVSGRAIEVPTCPSLAEDPRASVRSYPVFEAGGLIWVYLGQKNSPEVPDLGFLKVPDAARYVNKRVHPAHWLTALEADTDSGHVVWLHREDIVAGAAAGNRLAGVMLEQTEPEYSIEKTASGLRLAARRPSAENADYWRVNHWLAPWYTTVPADGDHDFPFAVHAFVPVDDENCLIFGLTWHEGRDLLDSERQVFEQGLGGVYAELISGTHVTVRNPANGYQINRTAQRLGTSWSGVRGNQEQDDVITSSISPRHDRSTELLVGADLAVLEVRRALLRMAEGERTGLAGQGYDRHALAVELSSGESWCLAIEEAHSGRRKVGELVPQ